MTGWGKACNTNILIHSLIAKVTKMELALETSSGGDDPMLPKTFQELRSVVMHLAQNDAERMKETKNWTDIMVQQSKDINDLKQKIEIINA